LIPDDRLSDARGRPIGGFPYWNHELTDTAAVLWKTGFLLGMPVQLEKGYWQGTEMPINWGELTLKHWSVMSTIGVSNPRTVPMAVRLACKFGRLMSKYVGIYPQQ
jgi:hypothetical protein